MTITWFLGLGLGLTLYSAVGQDFIQAGPPIGITFSGKVDDPLLASYTVDGSPGSIGRIFVDGYHTITTSANVKFKYSRAIGVNPNAPAPPNFVVLSPSSGTTPAIVLAGLNQSVLRTMSPGTYGLQLFFSTVDQSPPSEAAVLVFLKLSAPPPPTLGGVLSAATFQPTISPGEMVSIFGTNLAPNLMSTQFDAAGLYPTTLGDGTPSGNTTVTFDGMAAPLLYVSPGQINAVVPYGIAGRKTVNVVLTRYSQTATLTVPILDTSPGIFTATQTGTGQGAILDITASGFTYNSVDNPAPKGSVVVMFATGVGVWNPPLQDGAVDLAVTNFTVKPVKLTVGGKAATIFFAGTAPYEVTGMLQINAVLPGDVGSGLQPVVLSIGDVDNSQQQVTIAIK